MISHRKTEKEDEMREYTKGGEVGVSALAEKKRRSIEVTREYGPEQGRGTKIVRHVNLQISNINM